MSSLRQIQANRENALKSTGPVTAEGKEVSRRNALKDGLTGAGEVLPGKLEQAVAERLPEWIACLKPVGVRQEWLVRQTVLDTVRLEYCQAGEMDRLDELTRRASACWDEDRRLAVEALGATLHRRPELVYQQLRHSLQGCDWLLKRWAGLHVALDEKGGWDEAQRSLALDLLGTPGSLRDSRTEIDPLGNQSPAEAARRAARLEVESLEQLRAEVLVKIDASDRSRAERGFGHDTDRKLVLLRRYEAATARRFYRAMDEMDRRPVDTKPEPAPRVSLTPKATPATTTSPVPPAPSPSPQPSPSTPPPARYAITTVPVSIVPQPAPKKPAYIPPAKSYTGNRQERRAQKALARRSA